MKKPYILILSCIIGGSIAANHVISDNDSLHKTTYIIADSNGIMNVVYSANTDQGFRQN